MPSEEKPYRVYKGGRVKGKVPAPKPERSAPRKPRAGLRPNRRWLRWIPVVIGLFLVLVLVWALASYFQFRDGVSAANKRLPPGVRQALDAQKGDSTDILLLGTDHARLAGRESADRSDSITLLRVDTNRHRLAYLSIPRDLVVSIPGHGDAKINSAMQLGGPALAVRTVRSFTGLPVNHVVIVDFNQFEKLIDELGGIDIVVAKPIISKFDCPYPTNERCARWKGWHFGKGRQHMDGHRALIYSRVRKNALDPSDTDFSRAERNQQVLNAVAAKLTGLGTLTRLPFIGSDLLAPVATDIGTHTFLSLGWSKFRASASSTLHCRLGGTPSGGEILSVEENRSVISMVTGDSAPQPPVPGSGPFGPGCVTGNHTLGVR